MVKRFSTPRPSHTLDFSGPDPSFASVPLTLENVREHTDKVIASVGDYPADEYKGRGIVICGGGRYFPSAATLIYMLRQQRCNLPIELWYRGESEMSAEMIDALEPYNVRCVDGYRVKEVHRTRLLNGWELKSYAILHSSFEEVMLLDADNLPIINPEYLFDTPEFRSFGAIFWPDIHRKPLETSLNPELWKRLGNRSPLGIPEFESAQILLSKRKCWTALSLAAWFNSYSDFFYQYMYGDKETFHLAWATTSTPFGMPSFPIQHHHGCLCQHDFEGRRVFQHRHGAKFELHDNVPIAGFQLESQCLIFLSRLAARWDGRIRNVPKLDFLSYAPDAIQTAVATLTSRPHTYTRIGYDTRALEFLSNGTIGDGAAWFERFWDVKLYKESVYLMVSSPVELTCNLLLCKDGVWRGCWEHNGKMEVEIL